MQIRFRNWAIGVGALLVLVATPALAQVEVPPGETVTITAANGGSADLCEGSDVASCVGEVLPGDGRILLSVAAMMPDGAAAASADLFADFTVPAAEGGAETRLDSAIAVKPLALGRLFGGDADASAGVTASVEVVDMTDGVTIASAELLSEMTSDGALWIHVGEGAGSISFPDPAVIDPSGAAIFDVALARGHAYRVRMILSLNAAASAAADASSDFATSDDPVAGALSAGWSEVKITVGADIVDILARIEAKVDALDMRVEDGFAAVDARFDVVDATLAAAHAKLDLLQTTVDAIEGKVDVIDAKVDVIDDKVDMALIALEELRLAACDLERLIMTPQGRRASDLPVCEDQPGFPYDWPEPPLGNGNNGNGNGNSGNNGNGNNSDPSGSEEVSPGGEIGDPIPDARRGRGRRY